MEYGGESMNKGKAMYIRTKKRDPTNFEVALRMYSHYTCLVYPIRIYRKCINLLALLNTVGCGDN